MTETGSVMWITQASCGPEADTAMLKKCVKAGSCLHPYLFLRLLARKCDRRHISFMRRVLGLTRCKGPALSRDSGGTQTAASSRRAIGTSTVKLPLRF